TIGVQIARLNRPILLFSLFDELNEQVAPDKPGHQCEYAQDHDQCIVEDEPGLEPADHARYAPHDLPRTVHETAVNDGLVTNLPQAHAQCTRATGQDVFVDPVKVVLVLQQGIQGHDTRLDTGRECRIDHVHVIRGRHASQR